MATPQMTTPVSTVPPQEAGMYDRFVSELGSLADPSCYTEPLELSGCAPEILLEHLESMVRIRTVEEAIGDLVEGGEARCPCHLGIGQEAVAVGVSAHLNSGDRVFSGHRSHSHFLALGGDVTGLISEVLGKATGSSRGMGGSQHLLAADRGFMGSVPIVAATIPVAVGAALAAKMDGEGQVAVTYFGDGAAEEGVVHESLNLASKFSLPVLFVCENNLYSSHLDIRLRQPSDRVARFAEAHRMPFRVVDGNDVVCVSKVAEALISELRDGDGPAFIEAVTYRWRGHVGPDENIDVGLRRKREDLAAWKRRDPVGRLKASLIREGLLTEARFQDLVAELKTETATAVAAARAAPYPDKAALLDYVYKEGA